MPQPSRSDPPEGARAKRVQGRAALLASLFLGTALGVPAAAAAATATPDQAQAVEREIHDWLQAMLGTAVGVADRPVQLRPEDGGDYALLIPLGADSAITGHLAPQDDGRWLLSGVKLPSPASFTLDVPMPGPQGQPATDTTRTYQFSVARQQITGSFDPTYQAASTLQHRFEGFQLNSSGGGFRQTSQAAHTAGQSTLTPAADGRFDLASESTFDGYIVDNQTEGGGLAVHVTADRGRLLSQLTGISADHGPAFLRNVVALLAEILPATTRDAPPRLTAEQRTRLRATVDVLDDIASALQTDFMLEGLQVQAADLTGIARRVHIGFGGAAPDSVLKIYLDVAAEGLSIPGLPVGPYADLVPTDIHLRPTLAGIGTKELLGLARQVLDMPTGGMPPAPDPTPLFARGGIVAGLDAISFNVGPTTFAGRGTVTVTAPAPDAFAGQGQVTATNLDALIDRAKRDPTMQSALAVLTVAKGIGRSNGNQVVWDISYQDGKALVNGVDVMAMAGAAGGGAPPPPVRTAPTRPAPAPVAPAPVQPPGRGKPPPAK